MTEIALSVVIVTIEISDASLVVEKDVRWIITINVDRATPVRGAESLPRTLR